jgi:ADP-ribose pyrophosphatase YjhB (NUDIX family)
VGSNPTLTAEMQDKTVLISAAVVFKKSRGKSRWFVVKQGNGENDWEIPKTLVRRGESSVRAAIRMMAEQGGMSARVLEEVGRSGGAVKIKGKLVSQRHLYYLMVFKDGGEVLGYDDYEWLEYAKAVRKLSTKRDRMMLKQARSLLREVEKEMERG